MKLKLMKFALILAFCFAVAAVSQAQSYFVFGGFDELNGNAPNSPLVQGVDGFLYGTTLGGGNENCNSTWQFFTGCGMLFKAKIGGGGITLAHLFCSETGCIDGGLPLSVITTTNGAVYGTAFFGGTDGAGSFFKMTENGQLTTLHSFCAALYDCAYGYIASPNGVILGGDGNFYGTTIEGGPNDADECNGYGCGTAFKVTPAGKYTTLYNFCSLANCADGSTPTGTLLQLQNGNLYGTTGDGKTIESGPCEAGPCGTVFQLTPSGKLTMLHSFCTVANCPDGASPTGALVQGPDGGLYGTTFDPGTVFEITPTGKFKTLYHFCETKGCPDGEYPSPLILANDGNFYGTTTGGGANTACSTEFYKGCGTIFEITPTGTLTTLYNFCSSGSCGDGYSPVAALTEGTDGNLYGTTEYGGTGDCVNSQHFGTGCGVAFWLSNGLAPFVAANPNFGKAGQTIGIMGSNLKGVTGVTIDGVAATFQQISPYLVRAVVPTGATTGTIQVTMSSGTLNSNVAFQVLP
jgi:uncharacterized repeat protein (TIGR03803 family)